MIDPSVEALFFRGQFTYREESRSALVGNFALPVWTNAHKNPNPKKMACLSATMTFIS